MTLGSLFDGIGVWQLAAKNVGITPLWSCEIDSSCQSVSRRHFPNTLQLGDITKIQNPPYVDIITAGSPCQGFSIIGTHRGLADERSALILDAIRIVKTVQPKFFIWENVPAVLNLDKGSAFQAVLQELCDRPIPLPRYFPYAGLVNSPTCQIAWRVLDSQFFGVPQRRKRLFLVADFTGQCAAELLFEQTGLSRFPAPTPHSIFRRSPRRVGNYPAFSIILNSSSDWSYELSGTLTTNAKRHAVTDCDRLRFLTPLECERLMGLPDNWTDGFSDSKRYQMVGNSMALPCAEFVLRRLIEGR